MQKYSSMWHNRAIRTIHYHSLYAEELAHALGQLTLREDLAYGTFLPWRHLLDPQGGGLLASRPKWCPSCLGDWLSVSRSARFPLYWYTVAARCCIQHGDMLRDVCPHCQRKQPFLPAHSHLDHCSYCGGWLGSELFERDVSRFLLFTQIENHLDRLDDSINRATRRAVAYINYSLRTRSHIDRLIRQCVESAERADELGIPIEAGLPSGPLFSEQRLREPRVPATPPQRSTIRKRSMTPQERARVLLHKAMTRRRELTPRMIGGYLKAQAEKGAPLTSDGMRIETVEDLVAFASLSRLGMGSRRLLIQTGYPLATQMPDVLVALEPGRTSENEYLIVPKFTVKIMKGK